MAETTKIYKCDPNKNESCSKTACQKECYFTTKEECSVDGGTYVYDETKQTFVPQEEH